jgi:anthranilate 1,2-dioxygenase small subunit
MIAAADLRHDVEELYAEYCDVIDTMALARWPELFAEPCLYRIVAKENFDRGLPLSLVRCEGHGMLRDRAFAYEKLNVFGPRTWRHSVTQIRPRIEGEGIAVRANFVLFETVQDNPTQILTSGQFRDILVRTPGGLKFREKICIYDADLIPGSIVLPI